MKLRKCLRKNFQYDDSFGRNCTVLINHLFKLKHCSIFAITLLKPHLWGYFFFISLDKLIPNNIILYIYLFSIYLNLILLNNIIRNPGILKISKKKILKPTSNSSLLKNFRHFHARIKSVHRTKIYLSFIENVRVYVISKNLK